MALHSIASIFHLPRWLPFLWLFSSLVSQQASQYSFRGATGKLRLFALVIVVGDASVTTGLLAAAAMTIPTLYVFSTSSIIYRLVDAHDLPLQEHHRKLAGIHHEGIPQYLLA